MARFTTISAAAFHTTVKVFTLTLALSGWGCGAEGSPGLEGMIGPQGDPGPGGEQGAAGPQGATGPQGVAGRGLLIIDSTGTAIGSPVTLDGGKLAVFAWQEAPAADFPQDQLIASSPIDAVFFTGALCTGGAYAPASVLSQTYSTSVGIVVRGTGELFFPVNDEVVLLEDGEVILTTMLDGANGCVAIGSTGSLMVEVARSDKSFALNKPWSIAAN